MDTGYTLSQVLAVAKVHPFYSPDVEYPPSPEEVREIVKQTRNEDVDLTRIPLVTKEKLYQTISRLSRDLDPKNNYRKSSYISITGGGSGGLPMLFATDAIENRKQRAAAGALFRTCGLIEPSDFVLCMSVSGNFYRALDLTAEMIENAGGNVLCAGHEMSLPNVAKAVAHYRINAIAGDGSQVLQFANYAASLPAEQRAGINLTKVMYTSEPLNRAQRAVIKANLGDHVQIISALGSAEAGGWAVANPGLTGEPEDDAAMDFIFDRRMMEIEILPPSVVESNSSDGSDGNGNGQYTKPCPDGEIGVVIQTSLTRLRNPLLRYVTGDLGSLHPIPEKFKATVPPEDAAHLRILRLYGRDRRFSFKWFAEYFEFTRIQSVMRTEGWGILQWQLVLRRNEGEEISLQVRMLRSAASASVSEAEVEKFLRKFFVVLPMTEHLFSIKWVDDISGFERSSTGNKVMNFVDRTKS